jgi:hypothetical protein
MSKTSVLIFSSGHVILTFILFCLLYSGPTSGEAGMTFILPSLVLLITFGCINIVTAITTAIFKNFKWTGIQLLLAGFIFFESVFSAITQMPLLFGLTGDKPMNTENYKFIYSLSNLTGLIIMSLFLQGFKSLSKNKKFVRTQ